ncbi:MAG: ATP-binding cassette domain-containing protein [Leptospiraceae bacterium]|jgi:ABC-2 type transport system ATP-binding protein|nr:ATP-binding cassette domain-containing protein [Leptospiraceae bacterium]
MINVKDLTVKYGEFCAVDNVSFYIDPSSGITGLLGPNGAGKTTTMRVLTGYLSPTNGYIEIGGIPFDENPRNHIEIKKRIGYLPESNPLYPEMLVIEYLEFMAYAKQLEQNRIKERMDFLIETLELQSHLYTPLSLLSKGFRQRAALAATLIHDPEIIILDEPTTGLDPNQIISIRNFIKGLSKEKTLILSTHILKEVEDVCDRVIIINKGKIVADRKVEELQRSNFIVIVAKSHRENILEELKKVPIVKNVQEENILQSEFKRYICELREDKPEHLFNEIKRLDWEVREFSPLERSLEEVFRELTIN